LADDVKIREGPKLDSVDLLSVMLRVETQLGISLDSHELEKVTTVGDLLDTLQAKLSAAAKPKAA
jgi:acyl carrier protein